MALEKAATYLPSHIYKLASTLGDKYLPLRSKYRNWLKILSSLNDEEPTNVRQFYSDNFLKTIFKDNSHLELPKWGMVNDSNITNLQKYMAADFITYLRESILVKSDRCSMLNSIEARAPFLDVRLIEFAFNEIPDNLKIRNGSKKWLIKQIAKDLLPKQFDFERKLGFNLPLGEMIRKGLWKDFFGDIVLCSSSTIFNRQCLIEVFDDHQKGNDHTDRLFGIVLLSLWIKYNGFSL